MKKHLVLLKVFTVLSNLAKAGQQVEELEKDWRNRQKG